MADDKKKKKTLVGMGIPDELIDKAADAAKAAKETASDAVETAVEAVEAAADNVAEEVEAVSDTAEEAAEEVAESAGQAAESAEEAVEEAAESVEQAAKAAATTTEEVAAAVSGDGGDADSTEEASLEEADSAPVDEFQEEDDDDSDDGDVVSGVPSPRGEHRRPALYLAEYDTPQELYEAACQVRDAGYENWDCHTPYPLHGLDDAMGLAPTKLGIISFAHALIGLTTAVLMIQFMNNWDYPLIIGGKPPGSFPSMGPIMFELTVLLTGFGTLFGMLHLIGLPRHHHPIFNSDRFEAATDDKFFISIEVKDPKFDLLETRAFLEGTDSSFIELVEEDYT